ncbi:MAG TPA: hypothetical protein VNB23_04085 [Ramlibacter sp.]|nr:hypothetical protein [Ramlibacter sp.]
MDKRTWGAALLASCLLLAGCDTEDALLRQRLDVLKAEEAALQQLRTDLAAGAALEGAGAASVFLAKDLLNEVLAGADGSVIPVPGLEGATLTLRSLRTDFRMGFPLVRIDAVARKQGLDAQLELVGVARIQPVIDPGTPTHLNLAVHVDSLVPKASWGPLQFQVGGFVRDLVQLKLGTEARRIATVRVPIATDLPFALPARQTAVSFQGVHATVATPALSVSAKAAVHRVLTLPDGLHVYGQITAGGAL